MFAVVLLRTVVIHLFSDIFKTFLQLFFLCVKEYVFAEVLLVVCGPSNLCFIIFSVSQWPQNDFLKCLGPKRWAKQKCVLPLGTFLIDPFWEVISDQWGRNSLQSVSSEPPDCLKHTAPFLRQHGLYAHLVPANYINNVDCWPQEWLLQEIREWHYLVSHVWLFLTPWL